jgi:uncharacterized membrane protein (DUF4010 family)
MGEFDGPLRLLVAIFLGALVGLEREFIPRKKGKKGAADGGLSGLRTFCLISLLGGVAGLLSIKGDNVLYLIITIGFFVLLTAYYVIGSIMIKSPGLTTELAAVYVFVMGFLAAADILPIQLVIAVAVVITLILSMKEKTKSFIIKMKKSELSGFLTFAIVALVILPFLPNKGYTLVDIPGVRMLLGAYGGEFGVLESLEILNPFRMWMIVALITGIEMFGYFLSRVVGEKQGWFLASVAGGFVSSTSTVQSLALESKKGGYINRLIAAAVFANLVSFLQIIVLVAPINGEWLKSITPTMLLIVGASLVFGLFFYFKKGKRLAGIGKKKEKKEREESIVSLGSAVRFALVLVVIRLITKIALNFFGQTGFLVGSVAASFSGVDAVVVNLAELAGKEISIQGAWLVLVCVNATNLLSKTVYVWIQGRREFAISFAWSVILVVAASSLGWFWLG